MHFQTFYLGCLAQASYLIGDGGEAAVIDPRRDVDEYIAAAESAGLRITQIIETHFHADFVSGHRELAARTGARIVFGRRANADYPHHGAADGERIALGGITLEILETPGHTPESICILQRDAAGTPERLFTGDTLFIGDVGRPDLVAAKGLTAEQMAGSLYDSLHEKILPLPDGVMLHPGHGAGSACGKNISREITATLGAQRAANPMLAIGARDAFIRAATAGLAAPPAYFPHDARLNKSGPVALAELPAPAPLDPAGLKARLAAGAWVLDVRDGERFAAGHVPGAVAIGLGGQFASWAGTLLPADAELLLVCDDDAQCAEARLRLARVGLERVGGRLAGGIDAWRAAGEPLATLAMTDAAALPAALATSGGGVVLDVRRPGEYADGHVPAALSAPLDQFQTALPPRPAASPVFVICAGGYRSLAAASLLMRAGWSNLVNVRGGTGAYLRAGLPAETAPAPACASGVAS